MAATCLSTPNRPGREQRPERAKRPPGSSVREAPFKLVRDASVDDQPNDGLTLDGYGAVFNRQTLIDSWEGRFWEQIAPGSMKRSFRETPPKIQFDHGRHPLIGSIPVASLVKVEEASDPELAPDGGAHIVGRLLDNWLVQPVRDAIEARAVDGMSFRFEVVTESWVTADGKPIRDEVALMRELDRVFLEDLSDDELPIRTLRQLKVPEMGPVTWPAYEDTSVGVRSKMPRVIDLGRLHDPKQRQALARAVFVADALAAQPDAKRQVDTPIDDSQPDKIAAHASSLDAILDEASEQIGAIDQSTLPPEVAQVFALVQGAETVSDQLMDTLGVYDPDDDGDDSDEEDDDGRSGQQPTDTAGAHPTGEQRATDTVGEHSTTRQRATDSAGEHQPIPRGTRPIDLWVQRSRDNLLSIQAKRGLRT